MDKETYVSEIKSGLKGLPEDEAMIEEIETPSVLLFSGRKE